MDTNSADDRAARLADMPRTPDRAAAPDGLRAERL